MRRWAQSVGVAMLLTATLAGCASGLTPPPSGVDNAAAVESQESGEASAPDPLPRLSDLTVGTVIATGEFGGRGTTGRIEIRANGADHGFDVALIDISPAPAAGTSLELNALRSTASDEELQQGYSYYRYDPLAHASAQTFSTPGAGYGGFESNDPTYMRTAVIWAAVPGTPIGLGSVVATAPLKWDLPDMNPTLRVVDAGAANGANGQVGLAGDGTPITYQVARGDTSAGITERFGITTDGLEWLNPDRLPSRLILADITLNLARDQRGLRQ